MLYIYCEVSHEVLCVAIVWGPDACSTSKGVLFQVTIFGEMIREECLVMTEWDDIHNSSWVYLHRERFVTLFCF